MNNFNKGIYFAFDFIEKNMVGRVVNGKLEGVVTKDMLKTIKQEISRKCNFCDKPCETEWCSTKDCDE